MADPPEAARTGARRDLTRRLAFVAGFVQDRPAGSTRARSTWKRNAGKRNGPHRGVVGGIALCSRCKTRTRRKREPGGKAPRLCDVCWRTCVRCEREPLLDPDRNRYCRGCSRMKTEEFRLRLGDDPAPIRLLRRKRRRLKRCEATIRAMEQEIRVLTQEIEGLTAEAGRGIDRPASEPGPSMEAREGGEVPNG